MNNKVVVLTGGTGFIGSHVLSRLILDGYHVIALKRPSRKIDEIRLDKSITWLDWDQLSEKIINDLNIVAVIHLATEYGRYDVDASDIENANVVQPLRLLTLCLDKKIKFINTDSYFSKPEFKYKYMRPYIITKNTFAEWGRYFSEELGAVKFINMRLEHVYGENDGKDKFIPFIVNKLIEDNNTIDCTECTQCRDFVYVQDVVSAFLTVINADINDSFIEYQVGTGVSCSLKVFIEQLKKEIGTKNAHINYGGLMMRQGEIMESHADNAKLVSIGWKPRFNINDGIKKMINYIVCT